MMEVTSLGMRMVPQVFLLGPLFVVCPLLSSAAYMTFHTLLISGCFKIDFLFPLASHSLAVRSPGMDI